MAEGEALLAEAAGALAEAEWVLVAAGAGFSAESGLPTYEECRASGIEYDELCRAELLYEDPVRFYRFWASCAQKYREVKPHDGYATLWRLLQHHAEAGRTYVYTSNVDGHFRHLRGVPLCEIHGCCEEWLCSAMVAYAAAELLREPPAVAPPGGVVPLEGERFARVRAEQRRLLELAGSAQGCSAPSVAAAPSAWPTSVDPCARRAGLTEMDWACSPPRCHCGLPPRPAVLMFADEDAALLRHLRAGTDAYQRWEDAMEAELVSSGGHLVILELGVGKRVQVVREECECVLSDVAAKGGRATLIRVNPDAETGCLRMKGEAGPPGLPHIVCLRMKASEALRALEERLYQGGTSDLPAARPPA